MIAERRMSSGPVAWGGPRTGDPITRKRIQGEGVRDLGQEADVAGVVPKARPLK